jgi:polyisoprenoid-binding protein YceI
MMRAILIAIALTLASPAFAQTEQAPAGRYVIDDTHATIGWSVFHEGIAWYHARFTGFDVQLDYNPADVSKSKVTATIDPKSVETDYGKTGKPGTDFNALIYTRFLLAGEHPTITFVSTSISKTGERTGKMTGNLSFRGVTKPVTLDVTLVGQAQRPQAWKIGIVATGTILRSDFGVRTTAVADEIRLHIEGEFVKQ